jgi:glutaminyl-peptide cyclotransferase
VVTSFPHDRIAFTEGLVYHRGTLYESTGLYGKSELRRVDLETGRVLQRRALPRRLFGEGLALVGDRLILLTYKEQVANVYDRRTFRPVRAHRYTGDGWGLCHDGTHLVQSNGSSWLTFRNPHTFRPARRVRVVLPVGGSDLGLSPGPVGAINELECVGSSIWANVWLTNLIIEIDAVSGRVRSVVDASRLLTEDERRGTDVLNGIAVGPRAGTFLVTGKYWPRLFEVRFVPR